MSTAKTKKTPDKAYKQITAVKLRTTICRKEGRKGIFLLDYVGKDNFSKEIACTKKLLLAVDADDLCKNYRVVFTLHQNTKTNEVEYITTAPKDIYGAYEVEYEEDINLPDKDVYQFPK